LPGKSLSELECLEKFAIVELIDAQVPKAHAAPAWASPTPWVRRTTRSPQFAATIRPSGERGSSIVSPLTTDYLANQFQQAYKQHLRQTFPGKKDRRGVA
jgi:hypothetical protein